MTSPLDLYFNLKNRILNHSYILQDISQLWTLCHLFLQPLQEAHFANSDFETLFSSYFIRIKNRYISVSFFQISMRRYQQLLKSLHFGLIHFYIGDDSSLNQASIDIRFS